jgi:hypothetical protein
MGFVILLLARANQAVIDQASKHALRIAWQCLFARQVLRVKGGLLVHAQGCMGERNHASYVQLFQFIVHSAISFGSFVSNKRTPSSTGCFDAIGRWMRSGGKPLA